MNKRAKTAAILCTAAAVISAYFGAEVAAEKQTAISKAGLALIIEAENCYRTPYKCPANVWTNGVGNTHGVKRDKVLTIEEVAEDLRRNIKAAENCINTHFNGRDMNQNQFDSMVSLTLNLGCGNIRSYYSKKHGKQVETSIYRHAKAKNWLEMCNHIADFNKAGGKVLRGLVLRRAKEKALCLQK